MKDEIVMYEARWKNKTDFCCSSNTIKGAITCLTCFIPKDEKGYIYIYEANQLVAKYPFH